MVLLIRSQAAERQSTPAGLGDPYRVVRRTVGRRGSRPHGFEDAVPGRYGLAGRVESPFHRIVGEDQPTPPAGAVPMAGAPPDRPGPGLHTPATTAGSHR